MWIGLGAQFSKPYLYKYPTSVDGCLAPNMTLAAINGSIVSQDGGSLMGDGGYNVTELMSTTTQSVEELLKQK